MEIKIEGKVRRVALAKALVGVTEEIVVPIAPAPTDRWAEVFLGVMGSPVSVTGPRGQVLKWVESLRVAPGDIRFYVVGSAATDLTLVSSEYV